MKPGTLKTLAKMEKLGWKVHAFETSAEMKKAILDSVPSDKTVGFGGSVTIHGELKISEALKERGNTVWYSGLFPPEERREVMNKAHNADIFMMSSNAITEDGVLLNIDGIGNRVAAMIDGPKIVYIVVGENKFAGDEDDAMNRVKTIACPMNARRLNKKTPCATLDKCTNCSSPDRFCNFTVWTEHVPNNREFHIFACAEPLGY